MVCLLYQDSLIRNNLYTTIIVECYHAEVLDVCDFKTSSDMFFTPILNWCYYITSSTTYQRSTVAVHACCENLYCLTLSYPTLNTIYHRFNRRTDMFGSNPTIVHG